LKKEIKFGFKPTTMIKRIALILLLLTHLPEWAHAQLLNGPALVFLNMTHDFGQFSEEGGPVSYRFMFVNTGSQPLVVQNVEASCGCTSPDWTKAPVMPGDTGYVAATYDPAGRPGPFTKTLAVSSNANQPQAILTIKGNVLTRPIQTADIFPFEMGPIRLKYDHLSFSKMKCTEEKTLSFEVINTQSQSVEINFKNVPSHLTISTIPQVIPPNQEGVIKVTFTAKKTNDWDYVVNHFWLAFNGQENPNHRLSVSATIEEDFSSLNARDLEKAPVAKYDKQTIEMGNITPDSKVENTFTITNDGMDDLIIRKIRTSCGCTIATPQKTSLPGGESTEIHVVFDAHGLTGLQRKTITVITNDPKNPRMVLWLKGNILENR